MTPILKFLESLHRLTINLRIHYKVLSLTHKSLKTGHPYYFHSLISLTLHRFTRYYTESFFCHYWPKNFWQVILSPCTGLVERSTFTPSSFSSSLPFFFAYLWLLYLWSFQFCFSQNIEISPLLHFPFHYNRYSPGLLSMINSGIDPGWLFHLIFISIQLIFSAIFFLSKQVFII